MTDQRISWFQRPGRPVGGGGNTVYVRPADPAPAMTATVHTVEVGLQSKAWWWWRCTCAKWGSGYRSDSAARKDANGHKHYGSTA